MTLTKTVTGLLLTASLVLSAASATAGEVGGGKVRGPWTKNANAEATQIEFYEGWATLKIDDSTTPMYVEIALPGPSPGQILAKGTTDVNGNLTLKFYVPNRAVLHVSYSGKSPATFYLTTD